MFCISRTEDSEEQCGRVAIWFPHEEGKRAN